MKRIKISTLRSVLHDSVSFSKRSTDFINSIEKELNNKLELSSLEDYDCDLKLIFVESGGSEMLFKEAINNLHEPYYFLTSGEDNSLAASLEILTFLNNQGLNGEIIHGPVTYISKRINELLNISNIDILKGMNFGIIGTPSDWLISSIPEYQRLEECFGIKLIDISLDEINNDFENTIVNNNIDNHNFDKCEITKAYKVYQRLDTIVNKYHLDGLTLRCFDLLTSIKTTGCLALANLNERGISSACEGDIMALISMAIVKKLTGNSSFMANPSRINKEDNTILFAHCTLPLDMTTSYQYKTHFESGIGVAVKGELKEEDVTIFRLSSDLQHYFISSGKIIKNLSYDNLCRTQIMVKLDKDVNDLLTHPCGNHHIIFYGNYVNEINKLFNK